MQRVVLFVTGAAAGALLVAAGYRGGESVRAAEPAAPAPPGPQAAGLPLDVDCAVQLRADASDPGRDKCVVLEGKIVRVTDDWVIIRDYTTETHVPRDLVGPVVYDVRKLRAATEAKAEAAAAQQP